MEGSVLGGRHSTLDAGSQRVSLVCPSILPSMVVTCVLAFLLRSCRLTTRNTVAAHTGSNPIPAFGITWARHFRVLCALGGCILRGSFANQTTPGLIASGKVNPLLRLGVFETVLRLEHSRAGPPRRRGRVPPTLPSYRSKGKSAAPPSATCLA